MIENWICQITKSALGYVVSWPHSAKIPIAQVTSYHSSQTIGTHRAGLDKIVLVLVVSEVPRGEVFRILLG
jgi:hypothetical protein